MTLKFDINESRNKMIHVMRIMDIYVHIHIEIYIRMYIFEIK